MEVPFVLFYPTPYFLISLHTAFLRIFLYRFLILCKYLDFLVDRSPLVLRNMCIAICDSFFCYSFAWLMIVANNSVLDF